MLCRNCNYPLWNLTARQCPECGAPTLEDKIHLATATCSMPDLADDQFADLLEERIDDRESVGLPLPILLTITRGCLATVGGFKSEQVDED